MQFFKFFFFTFLRVEDFGIVLQGFTHPGLSTDPNKADRPDAPLLVFAVPSRYVRFPYLSDSPPYWSTCRGTSLRDQQKAEKTPRWQSRGVMGGSGGGGAVR